ncbi:hypothetical protein U9R90_29630 [Streptomyces sp. E11-3]|uniref:hypothetical protein n=1 Tax=Streptomyces sp. E11-3 TaxID=3110112 RepID=UPI00398109F4
MGNSGGVLVTRGTAAAELRGLMGAAGFVGVDGMDGLAEGWQVWEFADVRQRGLATLVEKSGTPAVMVSYLDSDVGFVEAVMPGGSGSWSGLLNREVAEGYEIPLEEFPVEPAVTGALAWSAAAGLAPDEALIRRALTGSAVFAEELAGLLFAALGIPGSRASVG